jgi:hypothetical protein
MPSHAPQSPTYISRVEEYMNAIKANVLRYPGTAKLTERLSLTFRDGAEPACNAAYLSGWELKGPNGTIAIHASMANTPGASTSTRLTLRVAGCASAEAVFGADRPLQSTVENVFPTITSWIDIVTLPVADPFASVVLPKVS